jgi:type VI secretion system Hcp family effector
MNMAFHVYAAFRLDGAALSGDTTLTHIGDVDLSAGHIELLELNFGGERDLGKDGRPKRAGRHRLLPLRIVKRMDQTTPLLYRALSGGETLEGEIKLFDADPETGELRHRFGVTVGKGRIIAMTTTSPEVLDPEDANRPAYDFLEIWPGSLVYADHVHGTSFADVRAGSRADKAGDRGSEKAAKRGKSRGG